MRDQRVPTYGVAAYRPMLIGLAISAAAASVAMAVRCRHAEPAWVGVAWLAVAAAGGWILLTRAVYRLALDGDVLHWWAPLRRGQVAAADLRLVRACHAAGGFAVVEGCDGSRLMVLAHRGLGAFLDTLSPVAPDLRVDLGRHARICERFNLTSWYPPDPTPATTNAQGGDPGGR